MYELRILSGLHRGATLPLDDHPHVIGAGDEDDVVLVDPGVEAQHATLSPTESGWLLSSTNGSICDAESNEAQSLIDLLPGGFARVGKVWISVADQDAHWDNPPPEPADLPLFDAADPDGDLVGDATDATDAVHAARTVAGEAPLDESGMLAPQEQGKHAARRSRRRRMFSVPFMLAAALSAAAAYAMTSGPDEPAQKEVDIYGDIRRTSSSASHQHAGKTARAAELTPEELRAAFRKRLSDAYLLKRFDLDLRDASWSMRGALDDEEARRFERILAGFMREHNITFPVHAKVGNGEMMLPFKISQVIYGEDASIVTQNGDRVYVGEVYRGVRVVAIKDSQLVFAGKRKIEVSW